MHEAAAHDVKAGKKKSMCGNEERVHLCEWCWWAYWTGNACADGRVMKAAQERAHYAAVCVYLYDSL